MLFWCLWAGYLVMLYFANLWVVSLKQAWNGVGVSQTRPNDTFWCAGAFLPTLAKISTDAARSDNVWYTANSFRNTNYLTRMSCHFFKCWKRNQIWQVVRGRAYPSRIQHPAWACHRGLHSYTPRIHFDWMDFLSKLSIGPLKWPHSLQGKVFQCLNIMPGIRLHNTLIVICSNTLICWLDITGHSADSEYIILSHCFVYRCAYVCPTFYLGLHQISQIVI